MAASAGKRNVGAPNYDDDTTIRVEGDDKAGIEAIQAGDADAEKVHSIAVMLTPMRVAVV